MSTERQTNKYIISEPLIAELLDITESLDTSHDSTQLAYDIASRLGQDSLRLILALETYDIRFDDHIKKDITENRYAWVFFDDADLDDLDDFELATLKFLALASGEVKKSEFVGDQWNRDVRDIVRNYCVSIVDKVNDTVDDLDQQLEFGESSSSYDRTIAGMYHEMNETLTEMQSAGRTLEGYSDDGQTERELLACFSLPHFIEILNSLVALGYVKKYTDLMLVDDNALIVPKKPAKSNSA